MSGNSLRKNQGAVSQEVGDAHLVLVHRGDRQQSGTLPSDDEHFSFHSHNRGSRHHHGDTIHTHKRLDDQRLRRLFGELECGEILLVCERSVDVVGEERDDGTGVVVLDSQVKV